MSLSSSELMARATPRFGGFKPVLVRLEIRRLLRNKRTLLFTMVVPVVFFLLFGLNSAYAGERAGRGNVSAFIMISLALYGAVLATTGGGAMVSTERIVGWSRQLRVTPLSPVAYIVTKMLTSLVLGLSSLAVVYAAGIVVHKPSMPLYVWITTAACVWIGSSLFAAFGLFVGYLLPSENVMQVVGFALMLFSFGGGLFIPLSQFSPLLRTIATYTPLYGLNQLVHYPLIGGPLNWTWVLNLLAWLVIFVAGASLGFRRDTARV
ncbi:MAG: ABC transporter permease [Acidimicrobiales bacterium]